MNDPQMIIKTLEIFIEDMKVNVSIDTEISHMDADRALVEVLRKIGNTFEGELKEKIDLLLELYDQVGKWYS